MGEPVDRNEIVARLARIKRMIAELESECGRAAELRERFERLMREIHGTTDAVTRKPQRTSRSLR